MIKTMRLRTLTLLFASCLLFSGSLYAEEAMAPDATEAAYKNAEKKAESMAHWWKYKFQTDPAYQTAAILPSSNRLPEYQLEEMSLPPASSPAPVENKTDKARE